MVTLSALWFLISSMPLSYVGLAVLLCVGSQRKNGNCQLTFLIVVLVYCLFHASFQLIFDHCTSSQEAEQVHSFQPRPHPSTSTPTSATTALTPSGTHSPSSFPLDTFTLLLPTLLLVLGPKSAPLFLLVTLIEWRHPWRRPGGAGSDWHSSFSHLTFLFFLALHLFFATSHSQSFSSLQIAASFIGFDTFHFAPAGALLALNTFAHLLALAWLSAGAGVVGWVCC